MSNPKVNNDNEAVASNARTGAMFGELLIVQKSDVGCSRK